MFNFPLSNYEKLTKAKREPSARRKIIKENLSVEGAEELLSDVAGVFTRVLIACLS
jgi:hypothetical protein